MRVEPEFWYGRKEILRGDFASPNEWAEIPVTYWG